jgi:hypothetical protein
MLGWFSLEFAWILLCLSSISALIQAARKLSLCLISTVPAIKRRAKNWRRNAKQGGRDSKALPLNVAMVLSGGSAERHS